MSTTRTITDGQGLAPTGTGRVERKTAVEAAARVIGEIIPYCERIEIAGSLRRGRETVGDVDLVAIPKAGGPLKIAQTMKEMHVGAAKEYRGGEKMVSAIVRVPSDWTRGTEEAQWADVQVDVYMATAENWGMILCCRTGSAQHNVWMAKMARTMGMKFAAGTGIETAKDAKNAKGRTEEEVFGALGLLVPEPRLREIVRGHPVWMD